MTKKQQNLTSLVLCAIFAALSVVLGRFFSYNVQDFSIGFGFLPVLICGMLCGVWWGAVCGALADFVGAILFPFGTYFPGFTAVAFLMGAVYGLIGLAERKTVRAWQFCIFAVMGVASTELVGSLLLNSLWLSIMYGRPYTAEIVLRLPEALLYFAVKLAFVLLIKQFVLPPLRKSFKRG